MIFEDNFVRSPIGKGGVMFDPVLKLRMQIGRWKPESAAGGGTINVKLFHDPEIEDGNYTMELEGEQRAFREKWGMGTTTTFLSPNSRQLIDILIDIYREEDETLLRCSFAPTDGFRLDASLLRKAGVAPFSDHPWSTILHFLCSIPQLPVWLNEFGKKGSTKSTSLYIPRSIALELADHTDFEIPASDADEVFVVRWEYSN